MDQNHLFYIIAMSDHSRLQGPARSYVEKVHIERRRSLNSLYNPRQLAVLYHEAEASRPYASERRSRSYEENILIEFLLYFFKSLILIP